MRKPRFAFALIIMLLVHASCVQAALVTDQTITLYPVDDATVSELNPDLVENGLFTKVNNTISNGSIWQQWSYAKFDLSAVPDNATITSAKILWYFFGYSVEVSSLYRWIDFWHVPSDNWSETTLTWNNKPVYDDTDGWLGRLTPSIYQGYYTFEFITGGIGANQWVAEDLADNGFSLALTTPQEDYSKSFGGYSGNAGGQYFRLELTYDYDDSIAAVSTDPATDITRDSATLNGTVNPNGEPTTATFQIGTDRNYGTMIAASSPGGGTMDVAVSAAALGLLPSTTYHFRIVAANVAGTVYGPDQTFTTTERPCGDVDGSLVTDLVDLIVVLRTLAGIDGTLDPTADCNGDHVIGIAEAIAILKQLSGS